ncbi:MAG: aminopeptidase [Cytophagales bacterium]|nr:aminopeptidase [Cytophagales bacterium]MDW8384750.1 aminopeptidase [Flammeovirgaceae bacterium]
MPFTKKSLIAGLGLVLVCGWVLLIYRELLWYCIRQFYGQMQIIWFAKPIEEYLQNPQYSQELKNKILLIQKIRRFAFDSIGLDETSSYTKLYDQQGKPLLWIVTACPAYELVPYEWKFPIIGNFSYKGFFDKEMAIAEAESLRLQGYDTDVGEVNAWSTLGFLNDPILSNMLYHSEGKLANLIIHELTHGTIYIKDGVEYNENLADFVGEQGAKWFLKSTYGENSTEYLEYTYTESDYDIFVNHVLAYAKRLDSLYRTFHEKTPQLEKQAKKQLLLNQFVEDARALPLRSDYYKKHLVKTPNNTYFMEFMRYQAQQNMFETECNQLFKGDLRAYVQYLKKKHRHIISWD